ncbi:MAG: hypothetical protein RR296_12505, partial [Clostridia bacterium]
MAENVGDLVLRTSLSTLYDEMIAEMQRRNLITAAFAQSLSVDAAKPLAEDVNALYDLFAVVD